MSTHIETWRVVSTGEGLALRRRGRVDRAMPGSSLFVLGATEPTEENTGAGVVRAAPTPANAIMGNITVGDGQVIVDRIIYGRVTITGSGRIENCIVRGGTTEPTTHTNLVQTSTATPSALGVPNISFTTIQPQRPSAWISGVGNKNYHAYRVKILDCVDGFGAFSTAADGLINVKVRGCFVANLAHFAPDYANNNRTRTHNDCIQFQGNLDPAENVLLEGNSFNARHNPSIGTLPTVYAELACIMVSLNTQSKISYTSRRNWYRGGAYTVNAGQTNAGHIVHDGDRFERPRTATPGPAASLVLDPGTSRMLRDLTYIDNGAEVLVTNG